MLCRWFKGQNRSQLGQLSSNNGATWWTAGQRNKVFEDSGMVYRVRRHEGSQEVDKSYAAGDEQSMKGMCLGEVRSGKRKEKSVPRGTAMAHQKRWTRSTSWKGVYVTRNKLESNAGAGRPAC